MAKEILKPNQVAAPTLFVGVGGTGGKIVTRIAEMCQPKEKENIKFVCLDTNVNDLNAVTKSSADIAYVQTSNTQTVGDYLNYDRDAMENWFPKNAVIYDKTVSEGAGQVRAISRLALNSTIKTGRIRPLYDAIDDLFRKDGKAMKQAMRVVIAATASGGTGSGIVMPLAMVIRDYVKTKYPNTSLIVRSLLLLPETLDTVITSAAESGSQRRNAYATIREINAFMMKGSGFFEVDEDLKRYSDLHVDIAQPGTDQTKSLSLLPFDFCFLLDGQNAEDHTMGDLSQYINQAARALYEQNIGPMQKDAFSVEDNIIKEMSDPGNYGRNRFGGIGASTLRYPYEDIADYIAYDWAIDAIGGEGEQAKWSKYDNEFVIKLREARKKGLAESECPRRSEVYVTKMKTATDNFSKDLRSKYLSNDVKRIRNYFNDLASEMHNAVFANSAISTARNAANELATEIDYKNNESRRGHAKENLMLLRSFENAVRFNARKAAAAAAEGIFYNDKKTILEKSPYTLEALLKNAYGDIAHPNAVRYLLYMVKEEMDKRITGMTSRINDMILPTLMTYSPDADDTDTFDAHFSSKKKERNLDELCAAEKDEGQDPTLREKIGGYEKLYETYNACFPDYYNSISDLAKCTAELEAYKLGSEYIDELNTMLERFYYTFPEKVSTMYRKQDDLVDSLVFHKGDSVMNVCADKDLLKELSRSTRQAGEENSMLDSELNGQIFDAIKANVAFEREIRNADVVENDRRIDVFDDILLGYFRESVRRNCSNIDQNIVEAIALENRLIQRLKARERQTGDEKVFDNVTHDDNVRHIRETLAVGLRLAAPGIQRVRNVESREIILCAYNLSLAAMRNFRMSDLLPKNLRGTAVDTVSRYEIHFFNALYNLTPDKLDKFAAYNESETGKNSAGLYHKAYMDYSKKIGPDSTKGSIISTHIDKRWDSVAVMPELDFKFQKKQVMRIHQAFIYGLLYNSITYRNLSSLSDARKVYKYENSDERYVDLIVSNGTLCDEFYEVLDALYVSSSIVTDMGKICQRKAERDNQRKSNYNETAFARAVGEFEMKFIHPGKASLFEIPLAYYNSLPNTKRYTGEISALVDAVVETLEHEIEGRESPADVKERLCMILREQFALLMDNYDAYEILRCNTAASENTVLDIIFRRIRHTIMASPEPGNAEEMIAQMRQRLK